MTRFRHPCRWCVIDAAYDHAFLLGLTEDEATSTIYAELECAWARWRHSLGAS